MSSLYITALAGDETPDDDHNANGDICANVPDGVDYEKYLEEDFETDEEDEHEEVDEDEYYGEDEGEDEGSDEDQDDEDKLGSRAWLDHYLSLEELENLDKVDEPFEFKEGELEGLVGGRSSDESSFNDDNIPQSEAENFSSDFILDNVGNYAPPLTNTKKALIYRLMQYQISDSDDDEENEAKHVLRRRALQEFRDFLRKKRAAKAYHRYMKIRDVEPDDINQEAFLMEKLEIVDKKLAKPYYYEILEPGIYKKLLLKRRRAVKRKYERYALDPEYRKKVQYKIFRDVGKYFKPVVNELSERSALLANYETGAEAALNDTDTPDNFITSSRVDVGNVNRSHQHLGAHANFREGQVEDENKNKLEEEGESEEVISEGSSFYDDQVPQSELDFFSSDYEEDCDVYYPGSRSKTLDRYRRYLAKCKPVFIDDEKAIMRKEIKAAEIDAQFQNYLEKRRTIKALTRVKLVDQMNFQDPYDIAKEHLNIEMVDKKLHRSYYYGEDEPDTYKILLGKRRRALIRKWEKFASDAKFQDDVIRKIYTRFLRIQPCPMFENADSEDDGESSFNDSEIPSSEEQFMSLAEIVIPRGYEKPVTRRKQQLYDELELYEPDGLHDTDRTILEKRKRRLDLIQRFKDSLQYRRIGKALARINEVRELGSEDPYVIANALLQRELADKKLNRCYYYSPGEPHVFKELMAKRIRAIRRKCNALADDKKYRDEYMSKLISAKPIPEPDYDREVTWQSFDETDIWEGSHGYLHEVSNFEKGNLKQRQREHAVKGIWPQFRESAPARFHEVFLHSFASDYGSLDQNKTYYEKLLQNIRPSN